MTVLTAHPAIRAETHIEPSGSSTELAEFSTELVDLSAESLMTLRTSSESALSLAIQRILEEGKTSAVVSAGWQSFHP